MDASKSILTDHAAAVGSIASQIWLWGQGVRPDLPGFAPRYGVEGRLTSAVDLVRGLGVLTGLEVLDVPGATAGFDNDYASQRDAALASLEDRDFFLLHVEATDEAAYQATSREGGRSNGGTATSSARSPKRSTRQGRRTGSC
jgi:2,3-bisphosphoglycerate-independent phosphoglycerate mutase